MFVEARPDNLSVKEKADGSCQIYVIDGYAFGQLITLVKWFRKEQRRVHRKRQAKHERAPRKILAQRGSGEELKGR